MSIYDRNYMRGRARTPRLSDFLSGSPTNILIFANAAAFLAQAFAERIFGSAAVCEWFALSVGSVASGKLWTLLTYSFMHGGLLHIMCNMLGLYFMGRFVERAFGPRRFLAIYFLGAIAGGLAWLALSAVFQDGEFLVGASASVVAVFAAFCIAYPPMPLTFLLFFVIPISMLPMTMLKVAVGFEVFGLLYSIMGGGAVVAYSAHLGGLALGAGLAKFMLSPRAQKPESPRRAGGSADDYSFKVNISGGAPDPEEVDRILEKIGKSGFASLTDAERDVLRRARDRLNNR